jgi:DNA modification methylase
MLPTAALVPYLGNARRHSPKQISQIAAMIREAGCVNPLLVADDNTIIAGHGRAAAAQQIGMPAVPVIRLSHLTPAQVRAYRIADNRLAELAGWDREMLAIELQGLADLEVDFDLELTGFDGAELDDLLSTTELDADEADQIPEASGPATTQAGDVWLLGDHRLVCGDARSSETYALVMAGERARMVFTDPPYNVPIDGHVGGLGKVARRPFVMASGEMSDTEFRQFLDDVLKQAAEASLDGAIHFVCMDWRSIDALIQVGRTRYGEFKNLIVWAKDNGGMGSFYRSQHELIAAFKVGTASHINTFGLGDTGRYRTNVWRYPGVNSFGRGRDEALAMHPTVKPVALVADAIRDVSRRNDIVLDPFGGSGTTLIAAERTRRRARLIELDPLYCDTICRRWAQFSGATAALEQNGRAFDDVAVERLGISADA